MPIKNVNTLATVARQFAFPSNLQLKDDTDSDTPAVRRHWVRRPIYKYMISFYSAAALQDAKRCNSYGNSVCLSVLRSVRHTLVPYPDE